MMICIAVSIAVLIAGTAVLIIRHEYHIREYMSLGLTHKEAEIRLLQEECSLTL